MAMVSATSQFANWARLLQRSLPDSMLGTIRVSASPHRSLGITIARGDALGNAEGIVLVEAGGLAAALGQFRLQTRMGEFPAVTRPDRLPPRLAIPDHNQFVIAAAQRPVRAVYEPAGPPHRNRHQPARGVSAADLRCMALDFGFRVSRPQTALQA